MLYYRRPVGTANACLTLVDPPESADGDALLWQQLESAQGPWFNAVLPCQFPDCPRRFATARPQSEDGLMVVVGAVVDRAVLTGVDVGRFRQWRSSRRIAMCRPGLTALGWTGQRTRLLARGDAG
jgi:hypothetical protein